MSSAFGKVHDFDVTWKWISLHFEVRSAKEILIQWNLQT